ncbi:MAG: 50S ribosomal protein L28 [Lachnospiraceae bacterium]|nr:50S ribosomal protein L28 [Lachnospiraceae bacterium]
MARCDVCGKGAHFGNNVSHSHRRSNHVWNANIKSVKCKVNGTPRRLHICTTCLKSNAVERA